MKHNQQKRHYRGAVLVVALIMLAVVTFIVIAYLAFAQRDRTSVNMSIIQTENRFLLDSGLSDVQKRILDRGPDANFWLFVSQNNPSSTARWAPVMYDLDGDERITPVTSSETRKAKITDFITGKGVGMADDGAFFEPKHKGWFMIFADGTVRQIDTVDADLRGVILNEPLPENFDGQVFALVQSQRIHPWDSKLRDDFRFYLDLNRDGAPQPTRGQPDDDVDGKQFERKWMVGDPHWIGVLKNPGEPHSKDNQFVGRFAYMVVPASKTLDLNRIHHSHSERLGSALANGRVTTSALNFSGMLGALGTTNAVWWPYGSIDNKGLAQVRAEEIFNYRDKVWDENTRQFIDRADGRNHFSSILDLNSPMAVQEFYYGNFTDELARASTNAFYELAGSVSTIKQPALKDRLNLDQYRNNLVVKILGAVSGVGGDYTFSVENPLNPNWSGWPNGARVNLYSSTDSLPMVKEPFANTYRAVRTSDVFYVKNTSEDVPGSIKLYWDYRADPDPDDDVNEEEFFNQVRLNGLTLAATTPSKESHKWRPSREYSFGDRAFLASSSDPNPYLFKAAKGHRSDSKAKPPEIDPQIPLSDYAWAAARSYGPYEAHSSASVVFLGGSWFRALVKHQSSDFNSPTASGSHLVWEWLPWKSAGNRIDDYVNSAPKDYRLDRSTEMFEEVAARLFKARANTKRAVAPNIVSTRSDNPYLGRPIFNIKTENLEALTDDPAAQAWNEIIEYTRGNPLDDPLNKYHVQYSPEVERILQVAANIVDVYSPTPYPTVFRPFYGKSTPQAGYDVIRHFAKEPDASFLQKPAGGNSIEREIDNCTVNAGSPGIDAGGAHGLNDGDRVMLSGTGLTGQLAYDESEVYVVQNGGGPTITLLPSAGTFVQAENFTQNSMDLTIGLLGSSKIAAPDDRKKEIDYTVGLETMPLIIGAKQRWEGGHLTPAINEFSIQWIMECTRSNRSFTPKMQFAVEVIDPSHGALPMELHASIKAEGTVKVYGTQGIIDPGSFSKNYRTEGFSLDHHFDAMSNTGGLYRSDTLPYFLPYDNVNNIAIDNENSRPIPAGKFPSGLWVAKFSAKPLDRAGSGQPVRIFNEYELHPWELDPSEIIVSLALKTPPSSAGISRIIDHAELKIKDPRVALHEAYFDGSIHDRFNVRDRGIDPKFYGQNTQKWYNGDRYYCHAEGGAQATEKAAPEFENFTTPDYKSKSGRLSGEYVTLDPAAWTMLNWNWNDYKNRHPVNYPMGSVIKFRENPSAPYRLLLCVFDFPGAYSRTQLINELGKSRGLLKYYGGESVEYSWQADDPVLNGRWLDYMRYCNGVRDRLLKSPELKRDQLVYTSSLPPTPPLFKNMGKPNDGSQPWDASEDVGANLTLVDNHPYKDPGVSGFSDWDFPSNGYLKSIGDLGRVHRGTPWQTIYFKAAPTNEVIELIDHKLSPPDGYIWQEWIHARTRYGLLGDREYYNPERRLNSRLYKENFKYLFKQTYATNDIWIPDEFNVFPDGSEFQRGLLSINQTQYPAWAAAMTGINLRRNAPPFHASPGTDMEEVVGHINNARGSKRWNSYSDVLNVRALSSESAHLPANASERTEAQYEALTRGLLPLLRFEDEERFVAYVYSQVLRPAKRGIVSDTVTNYKVVGEAAARTVFRLEGDPARIVVEGYTPINVR